MTQTNPPPWWAGLIALAFAAVIGFAMILIGALVVSDTAAAALLISSGTAAVVGVGIRASGRTARAERVAAAKRSDESGRAGVGLLAALAVVALVALLLPGCAWQTRRDGDTFELRLRQDPERPKPACLYRWTLDGELVLEGAVADCPEVPACREVTP